MNEGGELRLRLCCDGRREGNVTETHTFDASGRRLTEMAMVSSTTVMHDDGRKLKRHQEI
ncbi:hypothetical protein Csa_005799 [Cucumis sativus]|uniref:Uncharacterized protein n=1 Tax=Cucumis sativus TaxID=3659 RepID=A0A0A0KSN6_CUCSA|nr:hypothetical protein Csa_005799 [Cucumis sativus]